MLDFPSSPNPGQPYTQGGVTWTFDGVKWVAAGTGTGIYVPLTGGTMTGDLILNRNPQVPLGAATKQYVDVLPVAMNDNRIINGNFAVNQRAYVSGTALATTVYGHDRWKAGASGCTYTFTAALPDTTVTITAGTLTQVIEAGMIEGGVYTLSWTGTAQARVYQGAPTGSYAASPIVTASLTAGTNTIVEFNTGTLVRVKLEIGSVATSYNRQSMTKSTADCQRYYQTFSNLILNSWQSAGGFVFGAFPHNTFMRVAPTVAFISTAYTNASTLTTYAINLGSVSLQATAVASGYANAVTGVTLTAEL